MAYTKTNWTNDVTELNAENMNHIEDGIYNSQNVEIIAISDEAPSQCTTGDKYYNTEDNLIYTATGTNTWGATGEEPISGIFYILFSEQSSYSYDGTTLVSVGGGTEDIVISDTEPTEEGVKIWIDTGEISQQASEITNSYSESTGIGYSANYSNEHFGGIVLYNNASGSNGEITLSSNVSGYKYLEIYFSNTSGTSQRMAMQKLDLTLSSKCMLFYISSDTGAGMYINTREVTASGTKISTLDSTRYSSVTITPPNATVSVSAANNIYINKVVGYK